MNSEAYLCEVCSEIYRHEEELSVHMLEDHHAVYLPIKDTDQEESPKLEEKEELILPNIPDDVDLNAMMEVTDEIDFTPFISTGDPIPSAEFCIDVPGAMNVLAPRTDLSSSTPQPEKKKEKRKRSGGRKPREILTCEYCSYTTLIKSCMTSHRLTHTLDCPYCQFKTIIPDRLTDHLHNKHFQNNNWDLAAAKSRKGVKVVRKDYMKDEFILAEELMKIEPVGVVEDGEEGEGEFNYLRPSVILSSQDVIKVYRATQFIAKLS